MTDGRYPLDRLSRRLGPLSFRHARLLRICGDRTPVLPRSLFLALQSHCVGMGLSHHRPLAEPWTQRLRLPYGEAPCNSEADRGDNSWGHLDAAVHLGSGLWPLPRPLAFATNGTYCFTLGSSPLVVAYSFNGYLDMRGQLEKIQNKQNER